MWEDVSVQNGRWLRRISGFLSARLPELQLASVADPRQKRGRRWKVGQLLSTVLVGLMAGAKSLKDVEALTDELSAASRRIAGIVRRVADTTMRDLLVELSPQALRSILHRTIWLARRRKALEPVLFPFGVVAMDGKGTALPSWDDEYAQRVINEETKTAYGHLRTMTATLISVDAKPCIDAFPIPAKTNEVGAFAEAFDALCDAYPDLFTLCTYDAGGASEDNGAHVRSKGKHYFFRLNNERWHMQQYAQQLLRSAKALAETVDVIDNKTVTRRRVFLAPVAAIEGRTLLAWSHTRALVRVTSVTERAGVVISTEERFYASSLQTAELSADKWLLLARLHWGVEHTHNRLDVVFEEDDHPFITYDPQGALAVLLLRRVAYTLLALFRGVTLRSQDNRRMPWKDLVRRIYNALIAASDAHTRGLRQRETDLAFV
jgi:hypothetical protein